MKLTVAVCTWNRADLLDRTLQRMRELVVPAGASWELLVVNNNCADHTDTVIAKHTAALPLRRLFETKQGLSNARNCAVDAATGEFLIWTDDDVLVEPDWLAEYAKAFAAFPDAGYFGGTVDPWFEAEPPRWVLRHLPRLEGAFAVRRLGPDVRPLVGDEMVFGANMAFHTAHLREVRFDPALGRSGTGMLGGEETALMDRLRAAGRGGVWVGTARVRHFIPKERTTADYVWRYFHGQGRTAVRQAKIPCDGPQLGGAPRWMRRRYFAAKLRSLVLAPAAGSGWFDGYTRAATLRGMIDECRARAEGGAR